MNLSISNIAWNTDQDEKVYSLMQVYGFTGLEIAPTKLFLSEPYSQKEQATLWAKTLKEQYGFNVPSMQSIWFGKTENIFGTEDERDLLFNYTKLAIDFASSIECKNLVFGCPKNRNNLYGADNIIAIQFFKKIGDYAASMRTCIGMEANPVIYGTNYINTTEQAIELIEQVNSKGFLLNLDVGTMIYNNENISVIQDKIELINHVHISEPFLKKIEERPFHKELINFLQLNNYNRFVSIEMGWQESINDVENVIKYIRSLSF